MGWFDPSRLVGVFSFRQDCGVHVRPAEAVDLPSIVAIYNHYVAHSEATFDTELQTVEGKRGWLSSFDDHNPCFVCETDGGIAGYAYYVAYRSRPAYERTKEASVYVAPDARGAGVGTALYSRLIAHARARGVHSLLGVVGGENPASVALHLRFGFELRGHLSQVGFKFGRYLDTYYYEKLL